jgi:hypothetical protein
MLVSAYRTLPFSQEEKEGYELLVLIGRRGNLT